MMTDTKVTLSAVVACLSTGNEMPFTSLPEAITFGRRMAKAKMAEGGYSSVVEDNNQDGLVLFGEHRDHSGELFSLDPLVTVTQNWADYWSSLVNDQHRAAS